jgi:hypothetical protein
MGKEDNTGGSREEVISKRGGRKGDDCHCVSIENKLVHTLMRFFVEKQ